MSSIKVQTRIQGAARAARAALSRAFPAKVVQALVDVTGPWSIAS